MRDFTAKRAVLFDFYDTLARIDGEIVGASRRRIAEAFAVDLDLFHAQWRDSIKARSLGTLGSLENELASMLRALNVECREEQLRKLAEADRAAWVAGVRLYADTLSTLQALRQRGYPLGVVSNCTSQTGHVIRAHEADLRFDALALSFELGVAKPDPAIFQAACDKLGVAPSDCVFVADGADGELDTARSLGMFAVLVEHDDQHRARVRSQGHDAHVSSLTELLDLPCLTRP